MAHISPTLRLGVSVMLPELQRYTSRFCSFSKYGGPRSDIDPKILESLLQGPPKGTPNFGKPPFQHAAGDGKT